MGFLYTDSEVFAPTWYCKNPDIRNGIETPKMKNAMKKLESTLSERCVQLSIVVGLLFYFNVIIFKYLDRFLVRNFESLTGFKFSSDMLAVVHTVFVSVIFYFNVKFGFTYLHKISLLHTNFSIIFCSF